MTNGNNDTEALQSVGPGNNGGDGLVAARHLFHFGYNVVVYYPKKTDKPIYQNLQKQLHALHISFVDDFTGALSKADVVIDAIFGFGFNGNVRAPFDTVLDVLKNVKIPIAAVDIPSGWSVEKGDPGNGIKPDLLVSLSAPKRGVEKYTGKHFLGGRFVPPDLADEMGFNTPWKSHGGTEQCVDISQWLKL
ncbi:hypothetical protein PhCBS80983_g02549 [Powellomyces hirtus]|uniref:NAD(P)H-hydrate epimerase n=1 Tax=Powellomyces hirtus TaxID=109895 RepID=A0A507E5L1_9FUNG|nr:hypothetical protein PhCBS80983_g02549 [Powellomyces hirtus]